MLSRLAVLSSMLLAIGCGAQIDDSGSGAAGGGIGAGPTHPCPPGESALDDGSCHAPGVSDPAWAPGVPTDACGEGFVHDGEYGCNVVLPEARCGPGSYAVPGDTSCRSFDACGADPWPAAMGDALYVDASYNPSNGDGSMSAPFNQLEPAIAAAADGAVIALAAGSYAAAVVDKPLTLWGRCADMVSIVSSGGSALAFASSASASVVRDVALTGDGVGLSVSDATVSVERVWIHDTTGYGASVVRATQPASLALSQVLVEATVARGVYAEGASLTVDQVVVRDVAGRGINVRDQVTEGIGGELLMTTSLVERTQEVAVMIHASSATIDNSIVRETMPVNDRFGRAFTVQRDMTSTTEAALHMTCSNVEGGYDGGIVGFAATLDLEHITVRDVDANVDEGIRGYGIMAQHDTTTGLRSSLDLRHSLVERCQEAGVSAVSSDVVVDGLVARHGRHVLPLISGLPSKFGGRGINLQRDPGASDGVQAVISGSLFDENDESGVVVEGSVLELSESIVRGTRPLDPHYGRGIVLQDTAEAFASATLRHCEISKNTEVGLFVVGSDAYVESTLIRDTVARPDGDLGVGVSAELRPETGRRSSVTIVDSIIAGNRVLGIGAVTSDVSVMHTMIGDTVAYNDNFGDGVVGLHYYAEPAVLVISESLVAQSARAGVAAFGSDVTISSTRFDCNAIHLDSEPHAGRSSSFSDDGANVCGCGVDAVTCKALSSSIEPPDPPQL